ncbi:DegT/DnrJ/EryC1/StrS family aminotransferase [Desulfobaculum sp. SPO524]|uniref:DegT/DnrJ/EryC1/StrS family aminotransferase n=1 Tax=Desulfobaculum sp. SPO524 TaxID=3378071 RepID=UPI003851D3A2
MQDWNDTERIPLTRPAITQAARERVMAVLESGFLTEGAVTRELEEKWARFTGAREAVAVTSCTTGLELALRCMGIGAGDDVIVPDYTYPATALAALSLGATVTVVDVSPRTMLMEPQALWDAAGERTRAVIPVSLFGNPLDGAWLAAVRERGMAVIEDAACSLGAMWNDRHAGLDADVAVFSMHPRKTLTTGEGGMIITQDGALAAALRSAKHFGMEAVAGSPRPAFVRDGTNLKLSDVLSAMGVAQMDVLDSLLDQRRKLAERYTALFTDMQGVTLPTVTPGGRHGWQTFAVCVERRDAVMDRLRARGVEAQIGTYALHMEPVFCGTERVRFHGEMRGSARAFATCLALPLFPGMTEAQQDRVVRELRRALDACAAGAASA